MKISLNCLKKLVNIKVSDEELIRLIGARLVEVEGVIDERHKYDNIYVVKVIKAEKIPETHLTLCKIDVGKIEIPKVEKDENGLVQVVCGAPNVREGMLTAWIAPGAIVPASVHEDAPFVIGKRKMLGKYESNGMLAGADELDFGDDHSGIVEIEESNIVEPGKTLAEVFELNDLILEIENKSLTHRPDCFGLIGFAREVAGILGEKFAYNENLEVSKIDNRLKIEVEDSAICPRYTALILEKNGEFRKKYLSYIDTLLSKSGMRPVDTIVDATNMMMLEYGQPLHAFDYDKFVEIGGTKEPVIRVRLANAGEKIVLLDGKEIELNKNDIVICSNKTPVALAGAMGGDSTKIDETTRKIILESATFSLYNLRKTQMAHGIFSEAITRFTKGQPAYQTLSVAEQCASILKDGFKTVSVSDCRSKKEEDSVVKITVDEINGLLGTKYKKESIMKTLDNVGFEVRDSGDVLDIIAPKWRTDIHIKEDIIEEIGRLNGYDNITPVLPLHATAEKNKMFETKQKVREILTKYGANEVLTYSFVSGRLLERAGQKIKNAYRIVNSISPELQYVRQSIVPSLLEKAYMNEKLPVEKFAMFEMNKVYLKELGLDEEEVPVEKMKLGFLIAERKNNSAAFYQAKKYIEKLLNEFNVCGEYKRLCDSDAESMPFEKKRAAEIFVNGEKIGVAGEFRNSVRNEFKLAPYLAGFEIDLEKLMKLGSAKKIIDFTERKAEDLTVETEKNYEETLEEVKKQFPEAKISAGVIYRADGEKNKKMTFHIEK